MSRIEASITATLDQMFNSFMNKLDHSARTNQSSFSAPLNVPGDACQATSAGGGQSSTRE